MRWGLGAVAGAVLICVHSQVSARELSGEARQLAERTTEQLEAYAVRGDGDSIRRIAHPQFMTVFAPGLLESLDMVSRTASNVKVTRFDQKTLDVRIVGDTAVVVTRAEVEGVVGTRPHPSPILMTHTFVREGGKWLLLQRTMTPITVSEEVFRRVSGRALGERRPVSQ